MPMTRGSAASVVAAEAGLLLVASICMAVRVRPGPSMACCCTARSTAFCIASPSGASTPVVGSMVAIAMVLALEDCPPLHAASHSATSQSKAASARAKEAGRLMRQGGRIANVVLLGGRASGSFETPRLLPGESDFLPLSCFRLRGANALQFGLSQAAPPPAELKVPVAATLLPRRPAWFETILRAHVCAGTKPQRVVHLACD